jgi:hypothetical protein
MDTKLAVIQYKHMLPQIRNFGAAFNKEFYTNTKPRTRHISHIRLQGDYNNNKMERFNGERFETGRKLRED